MDYYKVDMLCSESVSQKTSSAEEYILLSVVSCLAAFSIASGDKSLASAISRSNNSGFTYFCSPSFSIACKQELRLGKVLRETYEHLLVKLANVRQCTHRLTSATSM